MKFLGWKHLRFVYFILLALVFFLALSYGIPLYRYLSHPVLAQQPGLGNNTRTDALSSPESRGNTPKIVGMSQEALLNADTAMLPQFKNAVDKVRPNSPEAYTGLGLLYQMKGKKNEAAEIYLKAISLNPRYPDAYYRLGTVYHEQGRLNDALDYYRKTIEIKPDYLNAHFSMGAVLQSKERLYDARDVYMKILSYKPGEFQALNNLGIVYEALGRFGEALWAYEEAAKNEPRNEVVKNNLIQMRESHPGLKPIAVIFPKPAMAPTDAAGEAPTIAAKPGIHLSSLEKSFHPAVAYTVLLKNQHSMTGAMSDETPQGFWLEIDRGSKVFVSRSEVVSIKKNE